MKVAILGLGYVGLPLAVQAAKKGYDVIGIDLSKDKVALINKGKSPIEEEFLHRDLPLYPIKATTSIQDAKNATVYIICVPTPVKNRVEPDLNPVKGAVTDISKVLKKGDLVIVESTINPGVCDEVVLPLLEELTGMKGGQDFSLAHCPERINPGDPKWNVSNIPRVLGALDKKGLKKALEFYETTIDAEITPMGNLKEAEACKVVENSFRDVNIAFVNELAMSFSKLGINVMNVINGAATKPFAFMPHFPGAGVGGHCIPVDPYYLIEYAKKKSDFDHDFLLLARQINSRMPNFTIELLTDALNEVGLPLKGTRIVLLGLAYKSNVDDDRESPSYILKELLEEHEADIVTFDPHLLKKSSAGSLKEALKSAKALLVATGHEEFKALDPKELHKAGVKVVIDGRNCLDKEAYEAAGIVYRGIGV